MPALTRDDGVDIHWEARGEGPAVVLAPHWNGVPEVFAPLLAELEGDHRVVTYDARGTGRSTRTGPHDVETAASDLEAVVEGAGMPAVLVATADATVPAATLGARATESVAAVVCVGIGPVPREALTDTHSMAASDSVIDAFMEMLANDYRGAMRTLLTAGNPQLSEEDVRDRVRRQVAYCPQDVAVARFTAWAFGDPGSVGAELGDRLWMLHSESVAGQWFPTATEMVPRLREHLPGARFEEVADGIVSRPDQTAAVVRRITAPLRG